MNPMVEFYPNDSFYKTPLGAVEINQDIFFRVKFSRPQNPEDVYLCLTKDGENEVKYPFKFEHIDMDNVYSYKCKINITSRGLYFYHFEVYTKSEIFRIGSDDDMYAMLGRGKDWQLTVYENKYISPSWLKGGIIYQIMVDRFNIGGERLKTKPHAVYRDDWGGTPEYRPTSDGKILNNDFFGGNLKGITKKLSYIKSLGANCIYLNPIFEARSNHKYDTGNYRKIDSDFGTIDDLKELIKKADKKDIKIIFDGVFSHTGDDSIYFNKYNTYDSVGAYHSKNSPYASWYNFTDFENKKYDSWWGIDILPNTVEEDPQFVEFICGEEGIISYWTEQGIGGWRLDVVDELPDKFLDSVARRAKRINPEALILGEVWEDASNKIAYSNRRRYLQGGQLDSVTNYPFKEDILHFVKTGDAQKINRTANIFTNNYPKDVLDNVMNLLSTHDTMRILTVLGDNGDTSTRDKRAKAKVKNLDEAITLLKLATLLQFTLMGVPCIYYGDEAGQEGFEDPFNRRCMNFDTINRDINRWYKKLGKVRLSEKDIFAEGIYMPIKADEGVYAFGRKTDSGEVITIVNNSESDYIFDTQGKAYTNLLTQKPFNGKVGVKEGVIIKLTSTLNLPEKNINK